MSTKRWDNVVGLINDHIQNSHLVNSLVDWNCIAVKLKSVGTVKPTIINEKGEATSVLTPDNTKVTFYHRMLNIRYKQELSFDDQERTEIASMVLVATGPRTSIVNYSESEFGSGLIHGFPLRIEGLELESTHFNSITITPGQATVDSLKVANDEFGLNQTVRSDMFFVTLTYSIEAESCLQLCNTI